MYEIYTSIEIEAKKEDLWNCLVDFHSYSAWNPFLRKIGIKNLRPHESFWLLVQAPASLPVIMKGMILSIEPQSLLVWRCHLIHPLLLTGIHKLELTETVPCHTLFVHTEQFQGILPPLLWTMIKPRVYKGFESMNKALKQKIEK
ncbi:SRPBCC domain-containing protein [Methylacidiphilum caldifontis]|uniref:SRPBCC domain-containing protein n=1 Tax=Methylacidiphilum caldifontis TaxID=2795386 RepID=UPI001A8D3EE2|nr:SRPBCC domain-containing protein [Methylacidiphilum caldifontis]QSR89371.1 SRPBCC domain-containing protein [Methylacidiphilum caldifontis]